MDLDDSPFKIKTSDGQEFELPARIADVSTFFSGLEKDETVTTISKIDGPTMAFLKTHLEKHDYTPPGVDAKSYTTNLADNIKPADFEVVGHLAGMDHFEEVAKFA